MEGLVNRCVVMSLQFGSISNPTIIPKCLALCSQIPVILSKFLKKYFFKKRLTGFHKNAALPILIVIKFIYL